MAGLFCAFLHSLGFLNKISLFYKNISTRYVTEVFQLLYQTLCLLFYRLRSTPKVTNNQKKLILFSLIRCRCCDSGFVYNLITKTVFVAICGFAFLNFSYHNLFLMFDVGRIFSSCIVILTFLSQSSPKFVFIWVLLYGRL